VQTHVQSGRSLTEQARGGDPVPPEFASATRALSNAEKLRTLTGAALDEAIRHFDPDWDGTGKSDQERRAAALQQSSSVREQIGIHAALLIAGAMTIMQFEGTDRGKPAVLVAMAWLDRYQRMAERLWMPDVVLEQAGSGSSIGDRIRNELQENPDFMAVTNGVRAWRNQKGEVVLVSFGAVPVSNMASIDRSRARDRALAQLNWFAGEQITARSVGDGAFTAQSYADGSDRQFDSSSYLRRIEGESKVTCPRRSGPPIM
jgi:hypothetical protein